MSRKHNRSRRRRRRSKPKGPTARKVHPQAGRPPQNGASKASDFDSRAQNEPAVAQGSSRPYQNVWKRVVAGAAVLAVIVGAVTNLGTLADWGRSVYDAVWQRVSNEPASASEERAILTSLGAGNTYAAIRETLGREPRLSQQLEHYDRRVFVMDTAYVVAFVDDFDNVPVLGLIMKNRAESGPIELPGHSVTLGVDTIEEVMDRLGGPRGAGGGCGQHPSYYEITGPTSNAFNFQEFAVGVTDLSTTRASITPSTRMACDDVTRLALHNYVRKAQVEDSFGLIDDHESYHAAMDVLRAETVIDSIYFTAPTVPITQEVLSLHPDEVTPVDPWIDDD